MEKKHFNKNLIMSEEEEKNFNQVTLVGYLANSLMMKMKKLEIIDTQLENLEAQHIGVVHKSSIN